MEELTAKVKSILAEVLGVEEEEVTSDSNLVDDLAAESIDFVDITYNLEQEFNIKINPGDIFPAFLREVEIFDENEKLTKEVKDKFKNNYPHIEEGMINEFEANKDPNIFFSIQVIVNFLNSKQ